MELFTMIIALVGAINIISNSFGCNMPLALIKSTIEQPLWTAENVPNIAMNTIPVSTTGEIFPATIDIIFEPTPVSSLALFESIAMESSQPSSETVSAGLPTVKHDPKTSNLSAFVTTLGIAAVAYLVWKLREARRLLETTIAASQLASSQYIDRETQIYPDDPRFATGIAPPPPPSPVLAKSASIPVLDMPPEPADPNLALATIQEHCYQPFVVAETAPLPPFPSTTAAPSHSVIDLPPLPDLAASQLSSSGYVDAGTQPDPEVPALATEIAPSPASPTVTAAPNHLAVDLPPPALLTPSPPSSPSLAGLSRPTSPEPEHVAAENAPLLATLQEYCNTVNQYGSRIEDARKRAETKGRINKEKLDTFEKEHEALRIDLLASLPAADSFPDPNTVEDAKIAETLLDVAQAWFMNAKRRVILQNKAHRAGKDSSNMKANFGHLVALVNHLLQEKPALSGIVEPYVQEHDETDAWFKIKIPEYQPNWDATPVPPPPPPRQQAEPEAGPAPPAPPAPAQEGRGGRGGRGQRGRGQGGRA